MASTADNKPRALFAAHRLAMPNAKGTQRGYVMVLSIILLLIITLMSVSMAKSFFLEEGMAGNTREKNRSFAAAQAALNYGEALVTQGATIKSTCTVGLSSVTQICTAPVAFVTNNSLSPLSSYFVIPASLLGTYMTVAQTIAADTSYAPPGVYIQFIGVAPGNGQFVYAVTAFGYGETPNSVSIVGSTFKVQQKTLPVNANSSAGQGN